MMSRKLYSVLQVQRPPSQGLFSTYHSSVEEDHKDAAGLTLEQWAFH